MRSRVITHGHFIYLSFRLNFIDIVASSISLAPVLPTQPPCVSSSRPFTYQRIHLPYESHGPHRSGKLARSTHMLAATNYRSSPASSRREFRHVDVPYPAALSLKDRSGKRKAQCTDRSIWIRLTQWVSPFARSDTTGIITDVLSSDQ